MNFVDKGRGQYDLEYRNCPCFWGTEPGKFAKSVLKYIKQGNVLDLGAGEGKNSIFLAELGFEVTAVEVSKYAIRNFEGRLNSLDSVIKREITIIEQDVLDFLPEKRYDLVIAYGLLHCLSNIGQVDYLIERIKSWTDYNGYVVIVSFNDQIGVPSVQDYLEPTLISSNYLRDKFSNFSILQYEDDMIVETHPTSNIEHKHSLSRMIAINDAQ